MTTLYKDMVGETFNRLTAIRYSHSNNRGDAMWEFSCVCGNNVTAKASSVRSGGTKSCGCQRVDKAIEHVKKLNTTHGMSGTPEHRIWKSMLARCRDKTNSRYGCRGISVCERWLTFDNFISDMGLRPSVKHSIERIDNNGNYEPENCKWATRTEQALNRVSTIFVNIDGVEKCLSDWCKVFGIDKRTVNRRINSYGWDVLKALTTTVRGGVKYTC